MADIGPWDTDENLRSDVYALQTDMVAAESDIDDLEAINADTDEPTGFVFAEPDTIPVTLSFDDGTYTLTVAPSASSFSFYIEGVKYTKSSSETIQIDNTQEGLHHIYYDADGALAETTTFSEDLLMKYAYVAAIYWDTTNNKQIYLGYECHGSKMDGHTHENLHETRGAQIESGGGGLGGISSDDNSPDADSTKFTITQAEFWDEDIHITQNAKGADSNIAIYYKSGADASDIWRVYESAVNLCMTTGNGGGEDRAAYNQNNGGTWQLTECTDNYFVLAHIFVYNDQTRKFGIILGQNQYSSKTNAREGASTELTTLDLRGILTQEIKLLATVIIQTKDTWTGNAIRSRVVTTDGGDDFIDWRNSPLPQGGTSSTVTDHGALGGLDDTDHPASAIFTDTTNFNGLLSAADTTVQAALDTLDNLVQDAITSGSASATITADGLDISDGTDTCSINLSSGDLYISNLGDGDDVYITGEVATDTQKTIFKGAPDGAAELYYAGTATLLTTAAGISITDGTATAATIGFSDDDFYITNNDDGGHLYLQTAGPQNGVVIEHDGAVTSYYGGTAKLKTTANGITIGQAGEDFDITAATGGDTTFTNEETSGWIYLKGRQSDTTKVSMAGFDPDGAASLYYAGTAILSTTAAGISITDGSATAATIYFDGDDLYIRNNDADGLLTAMAEKSGTGASYLFIADPDGEFKIYHNNAEMITTSADGLYIINNRASFREVSGSLYIDNLTQGDTIEMRVKNDANDTKTVATFDGDGAASLYYAGTAKLATTAAGISITDGSATAATIGFSSDDLEIKNNDADGKIYIRGTKTGEGGQSNMIDMDPDTWVKLYYAGTVAVSTTTGGIDINPAGSPMNIVVSGNDLLLQNRVDTGHIVLQADSTESATRTLADFDPDAGATIYYEAVAVFATTAAGISITDGTATAATIVFSDDDLVIANNDADGEVYIQAEKTGTGQSVLFHGDPDGAVSLYYNNTAILATTAAGISITDGSATAATIEFSDDDLLITNNDPDGVVQIKSRNAGDTQTELIAQFDPDSCVNFYDNSILVFQVSGGTMILYDSAGSAYVALAHGGSTASIRNYYHGGDFAITAENASGGAVSWTFDPDNIAIILPDASKIRYDDDLASDATCTGDEIIDGVDQNTVGVGGLLRKGSDGDWDDADKDASSTAGMLALAIESGTGASKRLLLHGFMRNDAWTWTPGEQLFLGDSGAITNDVSGYTTGDVIQVIGYAHTATVVYFNPSPTYDVVA